MKTKTNIFRSLALTAIFGISVFTAMAQAPESFNYQAVIRDASGDISANTPANLRLTILTGSATGTQVYKETQNVTTNEYGLVNHAIGTGTVESGTFANIPWGSANAFLKVEISLNNGPYANLGTQKLVSVPYALEAKHAASAASASSVNGSVTAQNALSVQNGNSSFEIKPGYYGNTPNSGATTLDMPGNAYLYVWDNLEVSDGLEVHGGGSVAGNVGIGTTSPSKKLDVIGEVKASGYTCHDANGGFGNKFNFNWTGSQLVAYIDQSYIGIVSFTSDRRLKEEIKPAENAGLKKVMSLKPVSFKYKDIEGTIFKANSQTQEGFIADELQQVIPSAVTGEKDGLTPDGSIQPQTINIIPVVSVLTKAMQEQQAQIDSLKAENAALKTDNATFKAELNVIKEHLGIDFQAQK